MEKTEKGTKKFTKEEKLAIIEEAGQEGVKVTLAKYDLYPATYYYWKKKLLVHGEDGLKHQTLKDQEREIKRLEKENESLKLLLGEKELESKLKDEMLKKKVSRVEKKALIGAYMSQGLTRDKCLSIVGLTKHQFYYQSNGLRLGKMPSKTTKWRDPLTLSMHEVDNRDVVDKIVNMKLNSDQTNWYRMISRALQIQGYYINYKKVYRLMKQYVLLESARKKKGRDFVKFRRVTPADSLRVLEMDIKYVWVYERQKYAYILTVIDTFTRYVLHWAVGYTMRSEQMKEVWEYVVAYYLQPAGLLAGGVEIEVRNDNGKQFSANEIIDFFETVQ